MPNICKLLIQTMSVFQRIRLLAPIDYRIVSEGPFKKIKWSVTATGSFSLFNGQGKCSAVCAASDDGASKLRQLFNQSCLTGAHA